MALKVYQFSNDCDFKKIAESGQCFRMKEMGSRYWMISGDRVAFGWNEEEVAYLECDEEDYFYWRIYFNMGIDYSALRERLKREGNCEFVTKAVDFSKGIRLLNQKPFETLISFIISQRKSIPAISKCIDSLCDMYGHPIKGTAFKSFPTAEELVGKDISKVSGIGYRDVYVKDAVDAVNSRINLDDLLLRRYSVAMDELKTIHGVGDKVASCTCLYGLGYRNAFPVDVWVQRIIDEDFNGKFPYENFTGNLGILQLFMFYYKRKGQV